MELGRTVVAPDGLDRAFAALADPTRRAILSALKRGDATVSELAAPFEISLPAISKHLKVLEASGLISRTRDGQFRPCHIERAALEAVAGWVEDHRRAWDERMDKLDDHLTRIQQPTQRSGKAKDGQ